MDLRQLRYLVALAEELSFTRAAANEHIAQPALSQQIRRLEDELGLALVERTTRHVSLTEAGQLLVVRARRILAELEAAAAELAAVRGVDIGHVTIGAMHTMGPVDLSLALATFHDRHPHVGLTVREAASEEMAEMLRVDELDLAFLSVTERVESHGLGLYQLLSEELVVLLPPDHQLSGRDQVRMAELADEPFISFRAGARLRELLFAAGRDAGFEPRVELESNDSQQVRRLVSRGPGSGDSAAVGRRRSRAPRWWWRRWWSRRLRRDITLAWREGRRHPPAATAFLELARRTFDESDAGRRRHRDRKALLLGQTSHRRFE